MKPVRRSTQPTRDVVRTLLEAERPMHGFEVARTAERPAGTAYNVLSRLEEAGHVTAAWEAKNPVQGRPPRRFYELTPDGAEWARELLAQEARNLSRPGLRPSTNPEGDLA